MHEHADMQWSAVIMAANTPMLLKAAMVGRRARRGGVMSSGQVVGVIDDIPTVAELIERIMAEARADTLARFGARGVSTSRQPAIEAGSRWTRPRPSCSATRGVDSGSYFWPTDACGVGESGQRRSRNASPCVCRVPARCGRRPRTTTRHPSRRCRKRARTQCARSSSRRSRSWCSDRSLRAPIQACCARAW